MALPPEKVAELKQIIHNQLSQMDVHSRIRQVLSESIHELGGPSSDKEFGEQELLAALREKGIVDDIMRQLQIGEDVGHGQHGQHPQRPATHYVNKEEKTQSIPLCKGNVDPTRRYLYLQVLEGKAFLEHLQEPQPIPGQVTSTFMLHVNFRGQRFKSRPVPCACEPDFQEGFLLEIHKDKGGDASKMADCTSMLAISDPIHLVLIKTDSEGDTSLVSSHHLEWRSVLSSDNARNTMAVEIMGVGGENKVPVGVLQIRLELIPTPNQMLAKDIIAAQINLEKNRQAERERLFLVYAKQWWKEYLQIRETHQHRLVKIFAQDENGVNRPVCAFVKPLRAGRLLDTTRQAARFVSVIGYERAPSLGGGSHRELWCNMHTFFCKNKGDCEDHAVLLCNLLLGFGLDAYVCVGTKAKNVPHTWVMSISPDGVVMFWESLTGHRYVHQTVDPDDPPAVDQPRGQYPYRAIGCVFNHQSFYANNQPSDTVELCRFELHDDTLWKAMSVDAVQSVCGPGNLPSWPNHSPLCPNITDASLASNDLEYQLRGLVTDQRKDLGLTTVWDDQLSYLLTPSLAAYEQERVTGVSSGNEEFQHAIRRAVPDGHTFKGFPIQFIHRNARRAFATCLRSQVCENIVCCRGDHVRLAVRVRVFTYPESACATWVMFACKYKSIL
ncbi:centrosomal protein of 76 kDa-like [Anneissia japonica]|uniref:centrosomal protein of 76 kDa-like n=1 Tax=Anneissia japonica TaxID=1529436 RepID=UPI00142560A0|nr:centrosomal protein of 76 kDa-like [Anneissia japonica]